MPISLGLTSGFTLQSSFQMVKQPFIIGICGGSCSGKSLVTEKLKLSLDLSASVINEFDFYHPNLTNTDNFDSPDAINWELLESCLNTLNSKSTFECPQYDLLKHKRKKNTLKLYPTRVVIVEGMFILSREEIRNKLDLIIFVDCPDDIRVANRIRKFTKNFNMSLEFIIEYYLKYTKIAYEKYIKPSKIYADIIVPNYGTQYESKGVDFMVINITQFLYGGDSENINRLRYAPLKYFN
ncbi:hypothetical protein SteCoe_8689 [Stentor coeruleus]|uniref:Phosphoribulokinase/uridine kinase domain-containing protein n=1 Tax=Stentor coeruleus TaxID=5963 RepID=A0A1R2CJK3_9CILI|nr:hypothetical protein SteCoe_8689 [Stentor coeruleus]